MTPPDLRAKAEQLIKTAVDSAATNGYSGSFTTATAARVDKIRLTAFVAALCSVVEQLQLTANVGQQLAPIFYEVKYPEPHKTLRNQLAALSRLEELTK